jgi:hypothetical protein
MRDYSKRIGKQIRDLAGLAHEREVRSHLEKLFDQFTSWKAGGIDTFDLTDRIHEFHNGPDRALLTRYANTSMADWLVSAALVDGVLSEADVPAEVMEAIAARVKCLRETRVGCANLDAADTGPGAADARGSDESSDEPTRPGIRP